MAGFLIGFHGFTKNGNPTFSRIFGSAEQPCYKQDKKPNSKNGRETYVLHGQMHLELRLLSF